MRALLGFLLTISGDMTPDEQAAELRRIITRGECMELSFDLYDLEACQCGRTGWIRMMDKPFYLNEWILLGNWH